MYKFDAISEIDRMIRDLEEMKEFYEKAIAREENDEKLKKFFAENKEDYDPWKAQIDDNARYLLVQADNAIDDAYTFLESFAEEDVDIIYEC